MPSLSIRVQWCAIQFLDGSKQQGELLLGRIEHYSTHVPVRTGWKLWYQPKPSLLLRLIGFRYLLWYWYFMNTLIFYSSYSFILFSEIGYIIEKDALPIQQLKFGKHPTFDPDYDYGKFTLGKLECSGRAKVTGMPTSCRDLYRIGHLFNDFYSIKKTIPL